MITSIVDKLRLNMADLNIQKSTYEEYIFEVI